MLLVLGLGLFATSSLLYVLMRSEDRDMRDLARLVTLYMLVAPGNGIALILILKHFFDA